MSIWYTDCFFIPENHDTGNVIPRNMILEIILQYSQECCIIIVGSILIFLEIFSTFPNMPLTFLPYKYLNILFYYFHQIPPLHISPKFIYWILHYRSLMLTIIKHIVCMCVDMFDLQKDHLFSIFIFCSLALDKVDDRYNVFLHTYIFL